MVKNKNKLDNILRTNKNDKTEQHFTDGGSSIGNEKKIPQI